MPEDLEQLGVANLPRIEDDAHGFGVAGDAGRDLFIYRWDLSWCRRRSLRSRR